MNVREERQGTPDEPWEERDHGRDVSGCGNLRLGSPELQADLDDIRDYSSYFALESRTDRIAPCACRT